MSRVYFNSLDGESEVRGSERAYAGHTICHGLAMLALSHTLSSFSDRPAILDWVPKGHYLHQEPYERFERSFEAAFGSGFGFLLTHPDEGTAYEPFRLSLNTAIAMGSQSVRLLARMHGQCEIHGYMEGEDRAFVADVIERGRCDSVMRPEMGWEQVIQHLRATDSEPVVTSYSVTETFPHPGLLEDAGIESFEGEEAYEEWYERSSEVRWEQGITALRRLEDWQLRWKEETFDTQGFGDGVSALDISRMVFERMKVPS